MVRYLILDENFTPSSSSSRPPPSSTAEVDDAIPTPEGGPLLSSRLTPRRKSSSCKARP